MPTFEKVFLEDDIELLIKKNDEYYKDISYKIFLCIQYQSYNLLMEIMVIIN